jgi:hypothetical protein
VGREVGREDAGEGDNDAGRLSLRYDVGPDELADRKG